MKHTQPNAIQRCHRCAVCHKKIKRGQPVERVARLFRWAHRSCVQMFSAQQPKKAA